MAARKVVVTRAVFEDVLDRLRSAATVVDNQGDMPLAADELAARAADADALVCALTDRVDAALLARCPKLRVVSNIAVGYNNIDLAACTAHGVMATNTPGVLDETTADFAWTLMLGAARRITEAERYLRGGQWKGWQLRQLLGVDVHHATLGIIGMGRIGQAVARRAKAFGMQIHYHNRKPVGPRIEEGLEATYWDSLDQMLARMDIVSVNCPHTPATFHLINARRLALMKPDAYIINTARGEVIDEAALARAIRGGKLAGAGLDVFEREPSVNPDLLGLPNVLLLPHMGSSTIEGRTEMGEKVIINIKTFADGHKPPDRVIPAML
jgi:glyoxylate reductase